MISDKTFTEEEFYKKAPEFAQAVANKIPGSKVSLSNDPIEPNAVIIVLEANNKSQITQLKLVKGRVIMTNVFGTL